MSNQGPWVTKTILELEDEIAQLKAEITELKATAKLRDNPTSRQALEGEPVAWWDGDMSAAEDSFSFKSNRCYTIPLYTHPASADEWIKCSEQTPNSGQRVILQSNGVIQNYMPLFEQGDSDFGIGDHFWDFEDINDIDNPLVNFEEDCWMPLPKPPKQEKSQ